MGDGFARHTPTLSGTMVVRALAVDSALLPHLGQVISDLTQDTHWLEVGESVPDIVSAVWLAIDSWYSPLMIGSISAFLGQLPDFWLPLDGSTHDQEDYPELFAQLDASFKNPGASTFTLPDFRDRFLTGALGAYALGDTGGEDSHVLTVSEMPAHNHLYTMPVASPDTVGAGAPIPSVMSVSPGTSTSNSGADAAHENRPNYIAVAFGIFSGRA